MPALDRPAAAAAPADGVSHYCPACDGPMRIVMASPAGRHNGVRCYRCEYMCDCGYREVFDEAV
jgi:formate dehydrogenase maturation protein FdhE